MTQKEYEIEGSALKLKNGISLTFDYHIKEKEVLMID